jgi:hypothetical protein
MARETIISVTSLLCLPGKVAFPATFNLGIAL